MLLMGTSVADAARILEISDVTLGKKEYKKIIAKAKAERKLAVHEVQWKLLRSGNVPMAIWLGKQVLGQEDKPAIETDIKPPTPKIEIIVSKTCASTLAEMSDKASSTPLSTEPDKPAE